MSVGLFIKLDGEVDLVRGFIVSGRVVEGVS